MAPDEPAGQRICPVCETRLPDDRSVRRCPICGAKALNWAIARPLQQPVVLFNARIAGIMAGVLVAMLALLVLGYRFPIPWGVALLAVAMPVVGYLAFGELASKIPASWRMQYMVGVLALNAGLLAAALAGVIGLTRPLSLIVIVVTGSALSWRIIHRAVTESSRVDDR